MSKQSKSIYVMSSDEGKVKVGISKNATERKKQLELYDGQLKIEYVSPLCENPYRVEELCHNALADYAVGREWFFVSVSDAVVVVKEVFSKNAVAEDTSQDATISFPTTNPKDIFTVKTEWNNLVGMKLVDIYYECREFDGGDFGYEMVMAFSDGKRIKRIAIDGSKAYPYGEYESDEYVAEGLGSCDTAKDRFIKWNFEKRTGAIKRIW